MKNTRAVMASIQRLSAALYEKGTSRSVSYVPSRVGVNGSVPLPISTVIAESLMEHGLALELA